MKKIAIAQLTCPGISYFQTEAPIDSSSLTRWRKRIGEEGVETLLMVSINAARTIGIMKASSVDRLIVDTTVMPKAIAHPSDSRLLEKSRQHLVNLKEGIVDGMRSMLGNPWDGHTLEETLEQVGILNDRQPKVVIVDKGYQGVEVPNTQILRSGQRRGVTRTLRKMIKRCSAIEPTIGHMKMDGRLGRNPLKGALGDALHAVLCGAGHNIRLLLKKLRLLFAQIWRQLIAALFAKTKPLQAA